MDIERTDIDDNAAGHANALADSLIFLLRDTYTTELNTDDPNPMVFQLHATKKITDFTTVYYEDNLADTAFAERPDGLDNEIETLADTLTDEIETHVSLCADLLDFDSDEFIDMLASRIRLTIYDIFSTEHIRNNLVNTDSTSLVTTYNGP